MAKQGGRAGHRLCARRGMGAGGDCRCHRRGGDRGRLADRRRRSAAPPGRSRGGAAGQSRSRPGSTRSRPYPRPARTRCSTPSAGAGTSPTWGTASCRTSRWSTREAFVRGGEGVALPVSDRRREDVAVDDRLACTTRRPVSSPSRWRRRVPRGRVGTARAAAGASSRVLTEGVTFEKCGVNRSAVEGQLPGQMAQRLGARAGGGRARVLRGRDEHRRPSAKSEDPHRASQRAVLRDPDPDGSVADAWFGGGTDLTPTYPYPDDAIHFHRTLKSVATGTTRPSIRASRPGATTISSTSIGARSGGVSAGSSSTTCARVTAGSTTLVLARSWPTSAARCRRRTARSSRGGGTRRTASASGGSSSPGAGATSSSTWCTTGARCSACRRRRGSRACS